LGDRPIAVLGQVIVDQFVGGTLQGFACHSRSIIEEDPVRLQGGLDGSQTGIGCEQMNFQPRLGILTIRE
jgi:hypothetical protein